MSNLIHKEKVVSTVRDDWQTKARGSNSQEYEIYLSCANDGKGGDSTRNGEPLLTFDEWLNS